MYTSVVYIYIYIIEDPRELSTEVFTSASRPARSWKRWGERWDVGSCVAEKSQQNIGKHGFCWIIFVGYRTSNLLIFQQISKVLRFQYFWLELSIYSNIGIQETCHWIFCNIQHCNIGNYYYSTYVLVELFLLDIFFESVD